MDSSLGSLVSEGLDAPVNGHDLVALEVAGRLLEWSYRPLAIDLALTVEKRSRKPQPVVQLERLLRVATGRSSPPKRQTRLMS
jgi:hypothetical protein